VALGWQRQGLVAPISWVALGQRSLFAAWYGWCAAVGLLLFVR